MGKYIDADHLREEIEKAYKSEIQPWLSGVSATSAIYDYVLPLIDSLQKEQQERIIPNDLEEASSKFATRIASNGVSVEFLEEKLSFQEGAKWQKEQDEKEQADLFTIVALDAAQRAREQLMKVAVNGWLDEDNEPPYDLNVVCEEKIPFGKFKHGDKVKLIIIKEE